MSKKLTKVAQTFHVATSEIVKVLWDFGFRIEHTSTAKLTKGMLKVISMYYHAERLDSLAEKTTKLFIVTNEFHTGYYGSFDNFLVIRAFNETVALSIARNKEFKVDSIQELSTEGYIGVIAESIDS
jgi:hypothetical protein